jgi:predicted phosphodiesterase
MLAIVSDIHSNYEALSTVMEDIARQGATEIICLGDVVGYGPRPRECLATAIEHFKVTLCGNHEWAIMNEPIGFNRIAREAVKWHQQELTPTWLSSKSAKDNWDYLRALPLTYRRGKMLFVHASPSNPTEEYLLRTDLDEILGELGPKFKRAFKKTEWLTFVGHTHYPGVVTEQADFLVPKDIGYELPLAPEKKYIINVGSVGQPRDGDNRACYVTLDHGVLRYHRLEYEIQVTYQQVLDTGVLDRNLGERLLTGS